MCLLYCLWSRHNAHAPIMWAGKGGRAKSSKRVCAVFALLIQSTFIFHSRLMKWFIANPRKWILKLERKRTNCLTTFLAFLNVSRWQVPPRWLRRIFENQVQGKWSWYLLDLKMGPFSELAKILERHSTAVIKLVQNKWNCIAYKRLTNYFGCTIRILKSHLTVNYSVSKNYSVIVRLQ